jgi:hypothetical protein
MISGVCSWLILKDIQVLMEKSADTVMAFFKPGIRTYTNKPSLNKYPNRPGEV